MGIRYTIDGRLVTATTYRSYNLGDVRRLFDAIVADEAFVAPMWLFADARVAPGNWTADEIRAVAEVLRDVRTQFAKDWVVVVPNLATFGLARMVANLLTRDGVSLHVFRDIDAAREKLAELRADH